MNETINIKHFYSPQLVLFLFSKFFDIYFSLVYFSLFFYKSINYLVN